MDNSNQLTLNLDSINKIEYYTNDGAKFSIIVNTDNKICVVKISANEEKNEMLAFNLFDVLNNKNVEHRILGYNDIHSWLILDKTNFDIQEGNNELTSKLLDEGENLIKFSCNESKQEELKQINQERLNKLFNSESFKKLMKTTSEYCDKHTNEAISENKEKKEYTFEEIKDNFSKAYFHIQKDEKLKKLYESILLGKKIDDKLDYNPKRPNKIEKHDSSENSCPFGDIVLFYDYKDMDIILKTYYHLCRLLASGLYDLDKFFNSVFDIILITIDNSNEESLEKIKNYHNNLPMFDSLYFGDEVIWSEYKDYFKYDENGHIVYKNGSKIDSELSDKINNFASILQQFLRSDISSYALYKFFSDFKESTLNKSEKEDNVETDKNE